MFSTILQELKGFFGRDFFLGAFFPILIFVAMNAGMYLEITLGLGPALGRWEKLPVSAQVLLLLTSGVAIAVAAYQTYNFQYVTTRIFEGYWSRTPFLSWLRKPRIRFHEQRLQYLRQAQDPHQSAASINERLAEQLALYPPPNHEDKIMPTAIGNILRASEIHAFDRYNIDSTIIWTRLRPLLPKEVTAALEDKKTARDFSMLISLMAAVFSLVWFTVLLVRSPRWELLLLCAGTWMLAMVSYRNAVQCTLAYGEQIKATFDVNRHLLLKALGREIPRSLEDEKKEWLRWSRLFYRNIPFPVPEPAPPKTDPWDQVANSLVKYLDSANDPADQEEQP